MLEGPPTSRTRAEATASAIAGSNPVVRPRIRAPSTVANPRGPHSRRALIAPETYDMGVSLVTWSGGPDPLGGGGVVQERWCRRVSTAGPTRTRQMTSLAQRQAGGRTGGAERARPQDDGGDAETGAEEGRGQDDTDAAPAHQDVPRQHGLERDEEEVGPLVAVALPTARRSPKSRAETQGPSKAMPSSPMTPRVVCAASASRARRTNWDPWLSATQGLRALPTATMACREIWLRRSADPNSAIWRGSVTRLARNPPPAGEPALTSIMVGGVWRRSMDRSDAVALAMEAAQGDAREHAHPDHDGQQESERVEPEPVREQDERGRDDRAQRSGEHFVARDLRGGADADAVPGDGQTDCRLAHRRERAQHLGRPLTRGGEPGQDPTAGPTTARTSRRLTRLSA